MNTAVAVPSPGIMTPVAHMVRKHTWDTHDTFTMELDPGPSGAFSFRPGQFNMLYVHGLGEVPISISGDPAHTEHIIHTVRAVGNVTRGLGSLRTGQMIGLRGPFGSAWPLEAAKDRDVVVMAGGIGLAPLRPFLYHLLSHRDAYKRVTLYYGARTPGDLLYEEQLLDWKYQEFFHVRTTVDHAPRNWRGNVGVVTRLVSPVDFDAKTAVAVICGPEIMMRFCVRVLNSLGVTDDRIYVSMERNMKCGIGLCGHCQYGPRFICKDGPVYVFEDIRHLFERREL